MSIFYTWSRYHSSVWCQVGFGALNRQCVEVRFVDIGRGLGRSGMRPVHSWPFHFYCVGFVCSRPVFWSKGWGGGGLKPQ